MCTVSYLPLGNGDFILTSNRDETPVRNAIEIRERTIDGHILLYPEDPGARGSWFAISGKGIVGCLLNGAYDAFTMGPQYTHSRGQVLLDSVLNGEMVTGLHLLNATAPFTLVLRDSEDSLREFIWDGEYVNLRSLDTNAPHFWSSVTLYPERVRQWRSALFESWLEENKPYTQESIIEFHKYGSDDDWNGFVMNRNERVRTLSITSVRVLEAAMHFKYFNLITGDEVTKTLEFQPQHDLAPD